MIIAGGKEMWEEVEMGKAEISGKEKRLDFGW